MAGRDFSAELFGPSAGRDFSSELFGAKPSKERTFGEAAKDIAAGVVSGAGSLVQLPGQLYGLATGDFSDTGALGLGKDISKFGEEMKSAGLKAREAERAEKIKTAEQKGQWEAFKTAFGETIKDPALLTSFLAEQAPQLLVPFGAAKVAQIGTAAKAAAAAEGLVGKAASDAVKEVTKAAAERGTRTAIGAGAVQQGADVGAQAYEDIYKELISKNADPKDAAQGALNLARAAGASGALISVLAQRLPGARTLEESFAGVPGTSGRLLGALKGAAGEGISEVVEETGGKFGSNLAMREIKPEQSLLEGLGQTAGMAAIGGVGMGGVSGLARSPARPEVAPSPEAPRTGPLTPEEQAELDRQRAASQRPKTTEELLAGIQTGKPTTAEDIARIRDEHETAVIEGLLAQDAEMKRANELAGLQREQQRQQTQLESEAEAIAGGISDIDRRVREGRIFSSVQDLIDRNIPFASTAINDINQKFGVINEAPLTEEERARVENIMGMVNTFTNFVNLPVLAPKPVDQFAENQAMEALIKERTERGPTEPLRTAPPAPSPRIEEAPVSQGVGEGPALRPQGRAEPSVAEDRELVTPAPTASTAAAPEAAPAVETPVAPVAAEMPARPDRAAVQSTLNTLADGDTIVTDDGDRIPVTRVLRNKAGDVTTIVTTKIGEEGYANIDFDGLASLVTPQPYIDSTTGERKFSAPATIEKPKAAAPAAVKATASAEEKVAPKAGDFVKLTVPGVGGPVGRAGKVEQILPSGDVEVRTQQGEIFSKPANEVTVVTPAEQKAEVPEAAVDVAQQIKDLKDQQTKLLTKSGKVPAPRSPARQKYDVLERQIAELENRQLAVRSQKPRKRPSTIMGSPMLAGIFNKIGGLHTSLLPEFSTRFFTKRLDRKGRPVIQTRNPLVSGYGTLFNKNGKFDFGEIAEHLELEGYLEPGSLERDYKDAGERAKELVKRALNGEEVLPIEEQIAKDAREREASERQKALDRQEENRQIATGELQLEPEFEWNDTEFEQNLGLDREFETDLEMYDLEPRDLRFLTDEELESELTDAEREQAQARRTRKAEEDAARQKAEGTASREDEALLTRPTAEGLKAKQEAADKAAAEERKAKAAEQERLRKEQQAKEEKARADETVKDFELGKSAEEQMTGMGDLFAEPPAPAASSVVGFRRATSREEDIDGAQFVYDVGNGARLLFAPSRNGEIMIAPPGKGVEFIIRTGDNRSNIIKTVDQFPDYIPENIRQIVLDYHKSVQGKKTDEEQTAVAMEMAEKIESLIAPKKEPQPKRESRQGTTKQRETADKIADEYGATVVYQDGDLALMRGFSKGNGQPVYMAINLPYYSNKDIESSRLPKDLVTPAQKAELIKIKQDLEAEDKVKFDKQPSIKFTDGLATSSNVSPEIAGIVRGWKDLLGLKVNLYITTIDDAIADRNKFSGPHRAIGSAGLDSREAGVVRRLPNGDYYIAFKKSTSKTKMLEVLAHELGHIHETEVFNNADASTRQQILDEHSKWLKKQTGKTAREFVTALRAKTAGKTTRIGEGMMASEMDDRYWKSFTEWYADQVSRWAVTSEKPVSVVEKFFSRLAQALKSFYSKIKNAGYLPNETFVQYLNKTHQPSDHVISTNDGSVQQMLGEVKAAAPTSTPGQQAQERKSLGKEKTEQLQDFQQTLRNLLNKFGLKDVGLNIVQGINDAGSYAQQLIRIAAETASPIRTLRHEAIHALRELGFFTEAQWNSLSKMAKDKWIDQYLKQRNIDGNPLKAGEESRYDAYMREYNGDMEKITEEAVADAFADFEATKPPAGMLQALLKRMKDLFQSIKSALTKVESVDQIFGKVEKGELKAAREAKGEAKSLRARATANFLRWFGDSKVVDMNGKPLVVYHGSKADITEFDPIKGAAGNQGMFFTTDIDLANVYGKDGAVYPVYISIKNPLILQGNERFAPQGIKGKLAKLLFPTQYKKSEREQRVKDMLFDGNAGRIFSKQDVELLRREGYDGVVTMNAYPEGSNLQVIVAFEPTQIKSAIGNNGDYSLTNADIRKSLGGVKSTPGQQALETIRAMGMGVKPPEPGRIEKAKTYLKEAGENPAATKESAKKTLTKWLDAFETMAFSGDAAFNNKITSSVIKDIREQPEILGLLLEASQSQAVNADNVVSRGIIEGSIEYNEEMKKWQSVKKDENFSALAKKLDDLAKKYGTSKEEMERIAHTYLVVKRLPGIIQRNKDLDAAIEKEQATAKPDRKRIDEWKALKVYVSPEQEAQVEPGLSLIKTIPELKEVSDIWQGIRQNTIKAMVDSGLWSPEYATNMFDNIDYVPYYREEQLEEGAGPLEFIRGLQVKSKEFQLKGSGAPVNDVFDNMIRWSQYAMNRAIRAQKARQMIDAAKDIDIGDRKMAVKVAEEKRGMNIVRVFRDGKQELWDMADPMFVPAFAAIQNVSIPMFKWAAKVADVLRNSVVLYPMFSVAQVPQDSFAAMFTSGLKPQHALKIPILAVKEFVKTLSKSSATHNELVKFGVVGARDFSADVMRKDAEIYAGLKPPKGGWGKTKEVLEHIAMAADNAVRQAVYEASVDQGLSKAEALEKAFEIFNVRRRGTSKALNLAGQTIPFFYAYLAAQRVAYRTITGVGTSPTERKAALQTLAATSAAVFTLSMLYAMAVGDDDDYAETPAAVRDRTLTIPGTGGVRIPLRTDFFLFPKIIAEHTYLMLTDKGYEDGAKFRRSMRDALVSAVSSPTPLPQVIKPVLEVAINYDFFTGKPVIGQFEKQKDWERQFNDSTSELSKLLGKTGLVSPIAVDHLIRGMFGSAGGLVMYASNFFTSDPDVPRPELSAQEMLAALPGTSGFLKRPQESALKNDFYILRDEVEKAVNTFNDIKTRSPQGMEAFLEDEKQMARLMLGKPVDKINRELSKIRRQMTIITNMPESQMSAEDKANNVRQLRELEREMLKSVNVKELREMAKI